MKCPICKETYNQHPAVSRKDNHTLICPQCGTREALEDWRKNSKHKNYLDNLPTWKSHNKE